MMPDGQVVFEISADGRKAMASIDDITRAMEKAGKKWDASATQSTDKIADSFGGMFKKISAAAAGAAIGKFLVDFGEAAIQVASDLQEVQNVVDVTFGSSANQIETWAKKAGTQFGLTELQAKRFTSTMGAMMKSAGLAGPEIVNMSTDLAGLAADMASFYNLDFETAFSKIRAGISGETEPLKQLGVNMSVANLEAYALSKGIKKAFNDMSQGEQVMLRYQYLMQATADAQGDFARTAGDSLANTRRQLETNLAEIQAKVGTLLIGPLKDATSVLNDFLKKITAPKPRTVLDEFADINLDTENKLKEIEATATKANELVGVLDEIAGSAVDVNKTSGLIPFIESFSGRITGLDGALKKAKENNVKGAISDLAGALSANLGGDPEKWGKLLGTISDNLPGAGLAASMDGGKTASFMAAAAAAADDLGGDYSDLWHKLLTVLGDDAPDAISALLLAGSTGTNLSSIASGANALNANSPQTWTDLLGALQKVDGLSNIFSYSGAGNVKSLADALSGNAPDADKAAAWQTFLDALGTNTDALSKLTGKSADETSAWLQKMKEAANGLNPTDAEAWNKLLANFVDGLPGLKDTEGGKAFFDEIAKNFLAMGTQSEEARAGLLALGFSSEEIDDKQKQWLETCKRLVQTLPGLSSIINTQTGEVKGGTQAVESYITAWKEGQEQLAMLSAYQQKKSALEKAFADLPGLQLDAAVAKRRAKRVYDEAKEIIKQYGVSLGKERETGLFTVNLSSVYGLSAEEKNKVQSAVDALNTEYQKAETAVKLYTDRTNEAKEAEIALQEYADTLNDTILDTEKDIEDASESMTTLEKAASGDEAAMKDVTAALENAQAAFKALADYQDSVRTETARTVGSVIKGFDSIITPAKKARDKMKELELANKRFTKEGTFTLEYKEAAGNVPTAQNMLAGLQSQLDYITEYRAAMDKAMAAGASEDLLAYLSDGTAESLDYLKALADGSADIKELNKAYQDVQEQSAAFTNELTQQKLAVDETYQGMKDAATDAVVKLNMYDGAKESVEATVQGIVEGLASQKENVQKQVDEILAQIARLQGQSGFGANFVIGNASQPLQWFSGSHANGLDYVPYDGYFAMLHQGERVQTAAEAELSRRYGNQAPSIDLTGAVRAGMGNMQIIWRGRVVADVLSEQQGDSFRALERSGWKS